MNIESRTSHPLWKTIKGGQEHLAQTEEDLQAAIATVKSLEQTAQRLAASGEEQRRLIEDAEAKQAQAAGALTEAVANGKPAESIADLVASAELTSIRAKATVEAIRTASKDTARKLQQARQDKHDLTMSKRHLERRISYARAQIALGDAFAALADQFTVDELSEGFHAMSKGGSVLVAVHAARDWLKEEKSNISPGDQIKSSDRTRINAKVGRSVILGDDSPMPGQSGKVKASQGSGNWLIELDSGEEVAVARSEFEVLSDESSQPKTDTRLDTSGQAAAQSQSDDEPVIGAGIEAANEV